MRVRRIVATVSIPSGEAPDAFEAHPTGFPVHPAVPDRGQRSPRRARGGAAAGAVRFLLGRYAPRAALVAGGVLILGTVLTSVMIFGPARPASARALEQRRDASAAAISPRAPARGGDEIAAVASAFNAMADDLAARAEALSASDRVRRQLLATCPTS